MTTVKTNSKEFTAQIRQYILDAIDCAEHNIKCNTEAEKLQFLADRFKDEYCNEYNLKVYGSYQKVFESWISGLPSCFNVEFRSHKIVEIAKLWNSLPQNATEKEECKIIDNWFNLVAFKTIQLMAKHNIYLY